MCRCSLINERNAPSQGTDALPFQHNSATKESRPPVIRSTSLGLIERNGTFGLFSPAANSTALYQPWQTIPSCLIDSGSFLCTTCGLLFHLSSPLRCQTLYDCYHCGEVRREGDFLASRDLMFAGVEFRRDTSLPWYLHVVTSLNVDGSILQYMRKLGYKSFCSNNTLQDSWSWWAKFSKRLWDRSITWVSQNNYIPSISKGCGLSINSCIWPHKIVNKLCGAIGFQMVI